MVFCGSYSREGEGWHVEGSFVSSSGEAFDVEPLKVEDRGEKVAAQHFFQALELMSEQLRYAQFCAEYASSEVWESAMTACDRAIELNPNTVGSRYTRAMVLRMTDRMEEALEEFQRILDLDPLHEDAMQNAGYVSALLGNDEQARAYYSTYLELNPTNASVRMNVAYQLAQAGDPLGAMQFIEVGLELDPDNVDLLKQHGGFAFAAGAELNDGQEEMPPEAAELFQKAVDTFTRVYELEGAEMSVGQLRSMISANINLQQYDAAVELGAQFVQTHGDEAQLWSIYADALQRADRIDDAINALERVKELDPEYANVAMRQGNWLLDAGRVDEAIPLFHEAIERGEQTPDRVAYQVWANGYQTGVAPDTKNWDYAIRVMSLARDFQPGTEMMEQINFWLGFSIFSQAVNRQEAQTLATAEATLPRFQEALRLFQNTGGYTVRQNMEGTRQQLIGNVNTYIEIQEAIIRRGR
jgi:tetratricopeptide (TPR) repeat protein